MTVNLTPLKAGLCALGIHLATPSSLHAGGAPWLDLPIDGITADNRARAVALLQERLAPSLGAHSQPGWQSVQILEAGHRGIARLRLGTGQLTLADVRRALAGTPFSIDPDRLSYHGIVRITTSRVDDDARLSKALVAATGNKAEVLVQAEANGTTSFIVADPDRGRNYFPLFTHQALTQLLAAHAADLHSLSWGSSAHSRREPPRFAFHCRRPYGARRVENEVAASAPR